MQICKHTATSYAYSKAVVNLHHCLKENAVWACNFIVYCLALVSNQWAELYGDSNLEPLCTWWSNLGNRREKQKACRDRLSRSYFFIVLSSRSGPLYKTMFLKKMNAWARVSLVSSLLFDPMISPVLYFRTETYAWNRCPVCFHLRGK